MRRADAVINASLKEGAVTVSFDCMALGKPLICLDTTGYTRYFSNEYAIIIPILNREQVVSNLKNGMTRLCNAELRKQMSTKAKLAGKQFTWTKRGEDIHHWFTEKTKESY